MTACRSWIGFVQSVERKLSLVQLLLSENLLQIKSTEEELELCSALVESSMWTEAKAFFRCTLLMVNRFSSELQPIPRLVLAALLL